MIYLYVKTHNKTGLKYLGKTEKSDPYNYHGSGKRWIRHLNKHGYDYTTEILLATENFDELKETGIYFSKLWNIVDSNEWANLMEETGTGGDNSRNIDYKKLVNTRKKNGKTWKQSEESNAKRSKAMTDKKKSDESIRKMVETRKKIGYKSWTKETHPEAAEKCKIAHLGKPKPQQHIMNMKFHENNKPIHKCPHCEKIGDIRNMKRWHFDRCKQNQNRKNDLDKIVTCNKCGYTTKTSPNFYKYHNEHCKSYDHND